MYENGCGLRRRLGEDRGSAALLRVRLGTRLAYSGRACPKRATRARGDRGCGPADGHAHAACEPLERHGVASESPNAGEIPRLPGACSLPVDIRPPRRRRMSALRGGTRTRVPAPHRSRWCAPNPRGDRLDDTSGTGTDALEHSRVADGDVEAVSS